MRVAGKSADALVYITDSLLKGSSTGVWQLYTVVDGVFVTITQPQHQQCVLNLP